MSDDSIQWLVDAQCADGGWQYSKPASANDDEHCLSTVRPTKDFFQSDTNTTSYVIQAVDAAGGASFATDPFAFFDAIRDGQRHGWGYTWGFHDHRRELDRAGDPGVRRGRHAGPGRRARRTAQAAGPACGGWSFTWTGSHRTDPDPGVDDRRDPRSAPAAAAGAGRRGRRCGDTCAGLRVARCGRDGRVRLTIALAVVLGAIAPVLAAPGIACAAAASGGPHAALVVDTGAASHGVLRRAGRGLRERDAPGRAGDLQQYGLTYRLGFGGRAVCMLAGVGATGDDCFGSYPNFWGYFHGTGASGWSVGLRERRGPPGGRRRPRGVVVGRGRRCHDARRPSRPRRSTTRVAWPLPPTRAPPRRHLRPRRHRRRLHRTAVTARTTAGRRAAVAPTPGNGLERAGRSKERGQASEHTKTPEPSDVSVSHGGRADVRLSRRGPRGRRGPAALERTAVRRPRWRSGRSRSWAPAAVAAMRRRRGPG